MPILRPSPIVSHSTTHVSPSPTGRRYVQFSVRLTCPPSQKPSRDTGAAHMEAQMSKTSATAPPCRLPMPLQRERGTSSSKVARASLGGAEGLEGLGVVEAEMRRRWERRAESKNWGVVLVGLVVGCGRRQGVRKLWRT